MATYKDVKDKINEFRSVFTEIQAIWPDTYVEAKEKIELALRFSSIKLNGEFVSLVSDNEINNIFHTINSATVDLRNFQQTKNTGYISQALNQIISFVTRINTIPSETFNESELRQLIGECKKAKDINNEALKQLTADQKSITKKSDSILEKSLSLLSNTTTGILSNEFERKRKKESGGLPATFRLTRWLGLSKLGTYQKDTIFFWAILFCMILAIIYGNRIFDYAFFINDENVSSTIKTLARIIVRLFILGPLVWLAVVQNKKMNLSKKLAEEYWHKEIIAKTFVGLSDQIDKNTEGETARDLRIKLLDLTLDAIYQNPADCIKNHNDSDNPTRNLLKLSKKGIRNANELLDLIKKAKNI